MAKCSQCKRDVQDITFFYNNKNHTTCFSCYERRKKTNNYCSECGIRASFNFPGTTNGIRCKKHSLPSMIDVKNKKCRCGKKTPYFNYPEEKKAICCVDCKDPGMVDVKSKKCRCGQKRPYFNYPEQEKAVCCYDCKDYGMVDVKSIKCRCGKKRPTFNYPEENAICCADCKDPGMVNVKSKKCRCGKKQPIFNYPEEGNAICCADCKDPGMVDVKHKKCSCGKKIPTFNYPEGNAICCAECKDPDMIDVKNKKCCCGKIASYGIPCNFATRCSSHKEEGMIKNPRAKCRKRNCKNIAICGTKNPIHCEEHKNDDDTNLVERACSKCGKIDVLIDEICVNFCSLEEQALEIKKNQKVKEKRVLKILTSEFGQPTEYNFMIDSSCGEKHSEEKEIGYDFETHKIFIEVDERQHKSYCEKGEINRMKNIFMAEGGIPLIFIRYNPDSFVDEKGKKQSLSQPKKEDLLIKWIKYYKDNVPDNFLSVKYLFYDGKNQNKLFEINPYQDYEEECQNCDKVFYVEGMLDEHVCY